MNCEMIMRQSSSNKCKREGRARIAWKRRDLYEGGIKGLRKNGKGKKGWGKQRMNMRWAQILMVISSVPSQCSLSFLADIDCSEWQIQLKGLY